MSAVGRSSSGRCPQVYSLELDPIASGLVLDANRFGSTGPVFASYADGSTGPSLADWQSRTHEDLLSTGS